MRDVSFACWMVCEEVVNTILSSVYLVLFSIRNRKGLDRAKNVVVALCEEGLKGCCFIISLSHHRSCRSPAISSRVCGATVRGRSSRNENRSELCEEALTNTHT